MSGAPLPITPHGGYRELVSYQTSEIIYDATVVFCRRFIDRKSRTTDQMVQAARSGKQNIAEGCMVSGTSKKTELKLISVARGSLEELLQDYQDYLRQHSLDLWDKEHPEARKIRALGYVKNRSYKTYMSYFEDARAEVAANTALCLINQANYLLDRQLGALQREFLEKGGFTERLYSARAEIRKSPSSDIASTEAVPLCPACSAPMKNRTARNGINAGRCFWGCSRFPDCNGTREMKE